MNGEKKYGEKKHRFGDPFSIDIKQKDPGVSNIARDIGNLVRGGFGPRPQPVYPPTTQYRPNFYEIMLDIRNNFPPEKCSNEKEFQSQLKIWLVSRYPKLSIKREVSVFEGKKIDIAIDNRYGIEAKIVTNDGVLMNLTGQILRYQKYFEKVGIVLLDVNKLQQEVILEFITDIKSRGVLVAMVKGMLIQKPKPKTKGKKK